MNAKTLIQRFHKNSQGAVLVSATIRGALRGGPVVCVGLLLLAGLDHWFDIQAWVRQLLWVGVWATALSAFGSSFFPLSLFSLKEKSKNLYRQSHSAGSSALRPDDFRVAVDLTRTPPRPGISDDLQNQALETLADKLRSVSVFSCFPFWAWRKTALFSLALVLGSVSVWALFPQQFPFGARVLFPFGSAQADRWVTVWPGDTTVPWGGDVEVKVNLQIRSINKPVLYVKTDKNWFPVEPVRDSQGTQTYEFKSLVEPLLYRVKWKKDWGRRYTITPQKPIQLTQFNITLQQPEYVGGEVRRQTSPELSGLPGTLVTLEAEATTPLTSAKLVFSDGTEKGTVVSGRSLKVQFNLFKSGFYQIDLQNNQEAAQRSEAYPIHVLGDTSPLITLLSPEDDLIVGDKETVPLTFSAEDDFGIKKIFLVWKKSGQTQPNRRLVLSYDSATPNILETYSWDLGSEQFKPGQLIRYQLEVWDGNSVTGPGVAQTEWRLLEIASFEKGHEALEEVLEKWREEILDLLAEVNTLKAKTDMENPNLEELTGEFNQSALKSQQLQKALETIVSLMEQDPLSDYGVWLEHQAMADNMQAMNQGAMKRTQAALQTKNQQAASQQMDQVAAELERMYALSEELSKSQRARDVLDSGDSLAEVGEDLLNELQAAAEQESGLSPEQTKQVNELIQQAQNILQDIARSLQKFPDDLPEDFVNQEALKDLELDQSQDILSQIQDAMKKGDFKKALDLARRFLDMAQKMQSNLSEAHESFLEENSASELAEKMQKVQDELQDLTQDQQDVLAETQKLESKRLAAVLKEQEKLLEKLARRQETVVENTQDLLKKSFSPDSARLMVNGQLKPMKDIAGEFRAKRVENSLTWLATVISQLEKAQNMVSQSTGPVQLQSALASLKTEEAEILETLKKKIEPRNVFSDADKKKFSELQKKQQGLSQKTKGLKQKLQRLSQKTASLGIPLTQSLGQAEADMGQASQDLKNGASQAAQTSEEAALQQLRKAQSALSQAQQAMGEMASEQGGGSMGGGSGSGQPRAIKRGQKSGSTGTRTDKVRLPRAEDYKPPKEFREELLESLKEKYPEIYEDIIYKYFKRLSE